MVHKATSRSYGLLSSSLSGATSHGHAHNG